MKLLLFALLAVFAVSCSSKKKVETSPTPAPVQEESPKVEDPVKTESEAPAAETTDTSEPAPSSGGDLPMIEGDSLLDVNCALGRDQRTISLLKRTDDAGWGVVYEKFGDKKTVAVARNDKSFCEEVVNRVKANLESAGFQCGGEGASAAEEAPAESPVEQVKEAASDAVETVKDAAKEGAEKVDEATEKAKEAAKETAEGE